MRGMVKGEMANIRRTSRTIAEPRGGGGSAACGLGAEPRQSQVGGDGIHEIEVRPAPIRAASLSAWLLSVAATGSTGS